MNEQSGLRSSLQTQKAGASCCLSYTPSTASVHVHPHHWGSAAKSGRGCVVRPVAIAIQMATGRRKERQEREGARVRCAGPSCSLLVTVGDVQDGLVNGSTQG
jgi:hypothetical protein